MKKTEKKIIQKQNNISYKESLRSYAELENRLKAMEEILKINDSEIN